MNGRSATIVVVAALALCIHSAGAKEIHLDCARQNQTAMVDIDTDRGDF